MIASFAGSSFATAPIAQDIPDIKLLTTDESISGFDLDDYVTDYDDGPDGLTWTIQSQVGFDGGDPVSITDPLVDIAAKSAPDEGVVTYRVEDAAEYSEDTQVVKYSSFSMAQPTLTDDNNLAPANDVPRTLIVMGENNTTTVDLTDLITPASAAGSVELSVSIADMGGNLLAGDGSDTATYGELTAMVNGSGELVVAAPTGSYPLTGMTQLSGAYRVGVKAEITGGAGDPNWDGVEFFVHQAQFPTIRDLPTTEWLNQFMNFESVPTGALATGFATMKNTAATDNPRWYVATSQGSPTVEIVDSGVPGSGNWATSGQALKVTLTTASDGVFILSDRFSDIQPGETVTFAANVTTTAAAGETVPNINMFMGNNTTPSNYQGLVMGQGGSQTGADQVPVGGASGWRTIQATFIADEYGSAIPDGEDTVNVYKGQGYQAMFSISANAGSTAPAINAMPLPTSIYIDNVRIYKDAPIMEKAFGATKIDVVQNGTPTSLFDGTLEAAATLAGNGLEEFSAAADGAAEIDVQANHANNMFNHDGSNSLKMYIPGAASRGTTSMTEFIFANIRLNAENAGGVNNNGDGIVGVSAWFKTDAAAPKDAPGVLFGLADFNFKNTPFADVGYAGAPLGGKWKKVAIQSVRYDAARLKIFVTVRADNQDVMESLASGKPWGSFTDANAPGYEADANVYIDDIQVHKYMDSANYFDRSVFPAD
jgi:hypothetical protein